nr:carboxypeptidase-like regulatory domain-containing protein [Candidatus Freyarchaeota archaeon]
MGRKKKGIILCSLFLLSIFLIGTVISQSSYTPTLLAPSIYSSAISTTPGGISPAVEKCHYTVIVNVTDYDNFALAGANVTVYQGNNYVTSKLTDSNGLASFYLYLGTYNFTATETYSGEKNSTSKYVNKDLTINLKLWNIATLLCRTQFQDGDDYYPIPNAYVQVTNKTSGQIVISSHVNATGWAEFHIKRSNVQGGTNYTITAFWDNTTQLGESYPNFAMLSYTKLNFTVPFPSGGQYIYTYILSNATFVTPTWGENVVLKIYWKDNAENNLNTTKLNSHLYWTLNFINGTNVYGPREESPQGSGSDIYYEFTVPWSLLYGGEMYLVYINTTEGTNGSHTFLPAAGQVVLSINALSMEITCRNMFSGIVNELLSISVQLNDTSHNETVKNAIVEYSVWDSNDSLVDSGSLIDANNSGAYYANLNLTFPRGNYLIEIIAEKENYTRGSKLVLLVVQNIPSVLYSSTFYFSDLNSPEIFFCSNYGQTENDVPFVILVFRFAEAETPSSSISTNEIEGAAISDASVSAGGLPSIPLGGGYYVVVVPTFGLPPSAYPIVVSASSELYEPQQSVFLLQGKERSVLIPLVNVRVPMTMLLLLIFSMAIPVSGFSGYVYVKRARIPALVRRIDQMIVAMSRGEKVDAKIFPRERLTLKILAEEMSIIGMEPKFEVHVPLELAGLLVPLLAESGMGYHEANALVTELVKAIPADREKLLHSVGVPGEISATVLKIIEEQEDKERKKGELIRKALIEKETEKETSESEKKTEEKSELVRKIKRARKALIEKETEKETSELEKKTEEKEDREETGYGKYERI